MGVVHLARIYGTVLSLAVRRSVAFRADLVFELVGTAVLMAASFAGVLVLFTRTQTLGGLRPLEVVVLVGTFHLVSGVRSACVEPNLRFNAAQVNDGTFDGLLLQPAPVVFLASLGGAAPVALAQALLGLATVVAAAVGLGDRIPPGSWIVWAVLVLCAIVIMWATRCIVAAVVFWSLGLKLDLVYDAVWQLGPYPTSIFGRPLLYLLSTLLPVAAVAALPTLVLTGALPMMWVLLPLGLAVGFTAGALALWRAGLKHYSSATS